MYDKKCFSIERKIIDSIYISADHSTSLMNINLTGNINLEIHSNELKNNSHIMKITLQQARDMAFQLNELVDKIESERKIK